MFLHEQWSSLQGKFWIKCLNLRQKITLYWGFALFSAIFSSHYTGDRTNWNRTNRGPPVLCSARFHSCSHTRLFLLRTESCFSLVLLWHQSEATYPSLRSLCLLSKYMLSVLSKKRVGTIFNDIIYQVELTENRNKSNWKMWPFFGTARPCFRRHSSVCVYSVPQRPRIHLNKKVLTMTND